jgi:hypothetical protein
VIWVFPAPDFVTWAAKEPDGLRIKQSVSISRVMNVAAGPAADLAFPLVVLPNYFPEKLPLVARQKVLVGHALSTLTMHFLMPVAPERRDLARRAQADLNPVITQRDVVISGHAERSEPLVKPVWSFTQAAMKAPGDLVNVGHV